ncbi:MAG: DUF4292 domain-containing protein [Acidobacteriota bacterium]
MKRTTRLPAAELSLPAQVATREELIQEVNKAASEIDSLKMTVLFELTGGSINTGEISKYRETDGFIIAKRPELIRLIGQAFKVTVFIVVSNREEFFVDVPPQKKYYHGLNGKPILHKKVVAANLRPHQIHRGLMIDPLPELESPNIFLEEDQEGRHKYYILNVVGPKGLKRKIWFDRFDLRLFRQKYFVDEGKVDSDITYSKFEEHDGRSYPSVIDLKWPQEDFSLRLTIKKLEINPPLTAEQFELPQPPGSQRVELNEKPEGTGISLSERVR